MLFPLVTGELFQILAASAAAQRSGIFQPAHSFCVLADF